MKIRRGTFEEKSWFHLFSQETSYECDVKA